MADLPIPFSRPMSLALREGRKTQTRRTLKLPTKTASGGPIYERPDMGGWEPTTLGGTGCFRPGPGGIRIEVPETVGIWHRTVGVCMSAPYQVGDRLWVREEHYRFGHWEPIDGARTRAGRQKWAFVADSDEVLYDPPANHRLGRHHKDSATPAWHKRLARFMFRRHSRITLLVDEVRVQRLHDISEADAVAEGAPDFASLGKVDGEDIGEASSRLRWAQRWFSQLWNNINGADSWEANPWVMAVTFRPVLANIDEVK